VITIGPGVTRWFACANAQVDSNRKTFTFRLTSVVGSVSTLQLVREFEGLRNQGTARRVDKKSSEYTIQGGAVIHGACRFTPQPEWERCAYRNPTQNPISLTFAAASACMTDPYAWAGRNVTVPRCSIGVGTPGAVYGTPRFTRILLFPTAGPVDLASVPTLTAAPSTGSWQPSFVFQAPSGDPRPLGGAEWQTNGLGLAPGEDFAFSLDLQFAPIDREYELYCFDSARGAYLRFPIDWENLDCFFDVCDPYFQDVTDGCMPDVSWVGVPDATQSNVQGASDFVVTFGGMSENKSCNVVIGKGAPNPVPWSTESHRCFPSRYSRTGQADSGDVNGAAACGGQVSLDVEAYLQGGNPLLTPVAAGEDYVVQCWYRDPASSKTTQMSDAVHFVVQP
jgi:hypothetical protein